MSGPISLSRISLLHSRQEQPRFHSVAKEPGLCELDDYSYLVGESMVMRSLRAQLRRVSPHFRVALITGEEGTGRDAVALALHRLNAESDASFFAHTSDSLLATLPELILRAEGKISAERGLEPTPETIFLPEAGALTYGEQMCLKHALERISESKMRAHLPRFIFATGRDLNCLAGAGHFDRALYRAISAVEIILSPLRSRTEDIPLITCGMLSRSAGADGTSIAFDGRALCRMQAHDWPGNVRELEQVVDLARQNARASVIEAIHLPPLGEFARASRSAKANTHPDSHVDRLDDVIQSHVLNVLMRCSGNKLRAAERLGISRSTLYRMLDTGAHERAS